MSQQKSIQNELTRWIILTALFFVLIGGGLAGVVAFYQARELQDHTLSEIATLVSTGKLKNSVLIHHDIEEQTIIINELGKKQHVPVIPLTIKDGLHTMDLNGSNWRVYITTEVSTNRRFSIAQQTELRNKIALTSSITVLLPLVFLVVIMLVIIRLIIRKQFESIRKLARAMDQQDGTRPKEIHDSNIPIEIMPFVKSINALLRRIRQTIQKQHRFISDASHELRTPITALSLQVENLTKATSQQDSEDRQRQLTQGILRLRELVSQLLDLARLQNNPDVLKEKILFNTIIQKAIEDLYPLAETKNIDVGVLKMDGNIDVMDLNGRLGQLVTNAISNAINYTPDGGKIDISLYAENNKAIFKVEDTGIGIPENELKLVKEPFYRVQESGQPGSGLGLAISHEIAQQLDGEIQLSNRVLGGLCFFYEQALA